MHNDNDHFWWCVDGEHHDQPQILVSDKLPGAEKTRRDGFQDCGYHTGACDEHKKMFGSRADAMRRMTPARTKGQ